MDKKKYVVFQFLIGRLATGIYDPKNTRNNRVSIPHRQARNDATLLPVSQPFKVSIPHRQARNRDLAQKVHVHLEFQFLIGRLATYFPATIWLIFVTVSIPHRQARNPSQQYPFIFLQKSFNSSQVGSQPDPQRYFRIYQTVSIPHRQARNYEYWSKEKPTTMVSIPHRQARNEYIQNKIQKNEHGFNSSQVGSQLIFLSV